MLPKLLHIALFGDMQYKRVVIRTTLCFKNLVYRFSVKTVGAESVNGFGGKSNKPSVSYDTTAETRSVFLLCFCTKQLCLHTIPKTRTAGFLSHNNIA